ncbi:MAG: acyl-CoA thioesterase II [Actinomycetia bacterium]|nr:acyl-CoA thioesterase II [Actinomycetes bacterium]
MSPTFLDELTIEPLEVNLFRAWGREGGPGRVFGGQVAAQAVMAAQQTVEVDHQIHSLHAYFLRAGDPSVPIVYDVDRIRDGRSFSTRRVRAIQHGEAIFNLSASFHQDEAGPDHQSGIALDVPSPEDIEPARWRRGLVDVRELPPARSTDERGLVHRRMWFRVPGELPDDPAIHVAAIAYTSDHGPTGTLRLAHTDTYARDELMTASLDHCMWFHRPARADEWLLLDLEARSTAGARGLAQGTIHRQDGVLVASVAQEGMLRLRR